jgi:HSP20 family protein
MDYSKHLPAYAIREASSETCWVPNSDVYIADTGLVINMELSGIRPEDLNLVVDGNRVKVSGSRHDGHRGPKRTFLVMEIHYCTFESIIEVPFGYDLGRIQAVYQNGFLRIEVPAAAPSSSQRTQSVRDCGARHSVSSRTTEKPQ